MSLNKAMIIGNLGRDPEMRYTPNGQPVTQFTVAVNRNYKDANGDWQEETEWFRVVAWGPLAERTAEYLRKGRKVYVEGRLQTRQWEDQSGNKRTAYDIVAREMKMLGSRTESERASAAATAPAAVSGAGADDREAPAEPPPSTEITDEDLPF